MAGNDCSSRQKCNYEYVVVICSNYEYANFGIMDNHMNADSVYKIQGEMSAEGETWSE